MNLRVIPDAPKIYSPFTCHAPTSKTSPQHPLDWSIEEHIEQIKIDQHFQIEQENIYIVLPPNCKKQRVM